MSSLIPLRFRIRSFFRKILKIFVLSRGTGLVISLILTFNFFGGIFTGAVILAGRSGGAVFSHQNEPVSFWLALTFCGIGFLCLVCTAYAWVRDEQMRRGEFK